MVTNRTTGREYKLAVVTMTKVDLSRKPDLKAHGHGLITVSPCPLPSGHWIVDIDSLIAMAYLIRDLIKDRWWVNNRIDLWSFNRFY